MRKEAHHQHDQPTNVASCKRVKRDSLKFTTHAAVLLLLLLLDDDVVLVRKFNNFVSNLGELV